MPPLQEIDPNTGPPSRPVGVQRLEKSGEHTFDESSSSMVNASSSQGAPLQPTRRYDFGTTLSGASDEEEVNVPRSQVLREDPTFSEFETYGIHSARWGQQARCRTPAVFTVTRGLAANVCDR